MHHWMMMAMRGGHMGPGFLMMGMVRRIAMRALIVVLVLAVAVLWFRLRQERARNRGW